MSELDHIIRKARDAKRGGWGVQSTGEKLASALVLNRPDWIAAMDYTLAEAIDRVGPEWLALIPTAERTLRDEADADAE
ncbi:MAG: hypothetical protein ACTS8S_02705 [Giesbergeria sp.]|jgi:hypothetical protein|nr:hypothetical protein [Burkholderiaceae bacterium]MDX9699910.1 hypothetical protein [Rhodocyclaceae bacterium]